MVCWQLCNILYISIKISLSSLHRGNVMALVGLEMASQSQAQFIPHEQVLTRAENRA